MYLSIVIIATMIKVAVTVVLITTNSIFWLYKLISAWHFCINFWIFVTSSSEYVRYVPSSEYTSSSRVWLWLCRHVWFPPIFLYSPWKVRSRGWMKLFELRPFPKHNCFTILHYLVLLWLWSFISNYSHISINSHIFHELTFTHYDCD